MRTGVGTGPKLPLEEFYASGRRKLIWQKGVFWKSKLILSQLAVGYKQAVQTGRAGQASQAGQAGRQGRAGRVGGREGRVGQAGKSPGSRLQLGNALNCLPVCSHPGLSHLLTFFKQFCWTRDCRKCLCAMRTVLKEWWEASYVAKPAELKGLQMSGFIVINLKNIISLVSAVIFIASTLSYSVISPVC